MGLFDRALSMLRDGDRDGEGGGSGRSCPHCHVELRIDDSSEGRYACENPGCTWEFFLDEGDGVLLEPWERTGREYDRRMAAGESDGPVTYRVKYVLVDGNGEQVTEDFSDVDQGYSYYEQLQRSPHHISVKWEHVHG